MKPRACMYAWRGRFAILIGSNVFGISIGYFPNAYESAFGTPYSIPRLDIEQPLFAIVSIVADAEHKDMPAIIDLKTRTETDQDGLFLQIRICLGNREQARGISRFPRTFLIVRSDHPVDFIRRSPTERENIHLVFFLAFAENRDIRFDELRFIAALATGIGDHLSEGLVAVYDNPQIFLCIFHCLSPLEDHLAIAAI
jgi:hypothetical protein